MPDSEDFQRAIDLVNRSASILVTTHARVDGDACGCVVVLREVLTALGKQVRSVFLSPLPRWYGFLVDEPVPVLGQDVQLDELTEGRFGKFDLTIVVDTNSRSQLPGFAPYLEQVDKPVLVIDHHVTADGLGDVEIVDATAAATGLVVFDLLEYAGWTLTRKMAEALFIAIATDTGWFQFNNTDDRVYRRCAQLVEAGALLHDIGRSKTHGIKHGVKGAKIAKKLGLSENIIKIIERHIGAGLPAEEARKLGLPNRDFIPETLEEKIVCHSDNLVDEGQIRPVEHEVERALSEGFNGYAIRLVELHKELSEICGVDVNHI